MIEGLFLEYKSYVEEGYEEPGLTFETYQDLLKTKTYEELIEETKTGEGFVSDEWLYAWCQ